MGRTVQVRRGDRYGRLRVMKELLKIRSGRVVECVCDCGVTIQVLLQSIRTGNTSSCGCYRRETAGKARRTHGKSRTGAEYTSWLDMNKRCYNCRHRQYHDYGGRGITVCERWRRSFICFLEDVGTRPSSKHTIDRIDNSKDYEPGNVRWATRTQQARNKRNNRLLTLYGETKCLTEWAEVTGIPRDAIKQRLKRGWNVEKALTLQVKSKVRT